MNTLHIVISSDQNYIKHAGVLCNSILKHNKKDFQVHIHLLSNGVNNESLEKLKILLETNDSRLYVYDMSNIRCRIDVNIPTTISITSYLRLFIGSILSNDIDKVIYMDVDAIVNKSLIDLWNTHFKKELVAGVLDSVQINAKKMIGIAKNEPYINAGMLLINLKLWREENLQQRFLDFLYEKKGNVYHHDQGIINAICSNRKMVLHPKFNVMTSFFDFTVKQIQMINQISPYYIQSEINEAKKNPVYIHFTPSLSNRPWMTNCSHPLKKLYLNNLKETPWRNDQLDHDNRKLRIKFLNWVNKKLTFFFYSFIIKIREFLFDAIPLLKKILKAK